MYIHTYFSNTPGLFYVKKPSVRKRNSIMIDKYISGSDKKLANEIEEDTRCGS